MSRDRFVKIEWGLRKGERGVKDFGHCDMGFKLDTPGEAEVYRELKAEGWTVQKYGWPDFLATKEVNGLRYARLIEVKSNGDQTREGQAVLHRALSWLGVQVEVIVKTNTNRTRRYRVSDISRRPKPSKRVI